MNDLAALVGEDVDRALAALPVEVEGFTGEAAPLPRDAYAALKKIDRRRRAGKRALDVQVLDQLAEIVRGSLEGQIGPATARIFLFIAIRRSMGRIRSKSFALLLELWNAVQPPHLKIRNDADLRRVTYDRDPETGQHFRPNPRGGINLPVAHLKRIAGLIEEAGGPDED